MSRITEREAERRRSEYRRAHPFSWKPEKNGKTWKLSLRSNCVLHHICRGRLSHDFEQPENYFMLHDGIQFREHMEWAHGEGKGENVEDNRLWMFAVKYLACEATFQQIKLLMKGRKWCTVSDEDTLENEIIKRVKELSLSIGYFPRKGGVIEASIPVGSY